MRPSPSVERISRKLAPGRELAIGFLRRLGLHTPLRALKRRLSCLGIDNFFLRSYLDDPARRLLMAADDPVRYGAIFLAMNRIRSLGIRGSIAEVGVYRGETSRFIHALAPERMFYLFDTFEGFPEDDLEHRGGDTRFRDTSVETVLQTIGDQTNIVVRKGWFPGTAKGLEDERFAFVMLDADLFKPTLGGLRFFYPRLSPGGYLFLHDYNSPESDWAVSRAVDGFLDDKPEKVVEIPDSYGTAILRKT